MPWSYVSHVCPIEDHRDDIIVENLPELLSDIVNTERVFQGKVELFPLAPMGVLAPGSAHARPSARPPIDTSGNFSAHVSAE